MAENRLGFFVCSESDLRHCWSRFPVVVFSLTLPLKNEISNVRFKGRQNKNKTSIDSIFFVLQTTAISLLMTQIGEQVNKKEIFLYYDVSVRLS